MPHIIIEYSQNSIDKNQITAMMIELRQAVKCTQIFDEDNIKIRLHKTDEFLLSANYDGFLHIQCRMHAGRTVAEKKSLTTTLLNQLEKRVNEKIVMTCEIVDMDSGSYSKLIVG